MEKNRIHIGIGVLILVMAQVFYTQFGTDGVALSLTFVMVYWWIAQPLPIYVTALLPLLVGPYLGLIDFTDLALSYGNKMVFLFFGGFLIALGIEKTNLHKHFAHYIIALVGKSINTLLLSFMLATAFLSMWISNTATALMMLPMALSVIDSVPRFKLKKRFSIALLLGVAFAANIGGTATLIGTPPNVLMAGILEEQFDIKVTFMEWLKIGLPFMLVMFFVAYFLLRTLFLKNVEIVVPQKETVKMNKNQKRMLVVFGLTVLFWISGSWVNAFLPFSLNDTMIALFGGVLLFIVPSEQGASLLSWEDTKKLPWGILFLFGGGLALASILDKTSLLTSLVEYFKTLEALNAMVIVVVLLVLTVFLTELMSNLALVSLLLPLVGALCLSFGLPLKEIAAGIALSSSCAFMLPVATPPNAIVFSANKFSVLTMVKVGVLLNLVTIVLVSVLVYWYGLS